MNELCLIEVWGEPAGILLEDQRSFRFYAVSCLYSVLNGKSFDTRGHARLAAIRLQKQAIGRLPL
jgi:hypothetical protein